ncbi:MULTISPECIES: carboxypeptidase-like regulatory domain-containing protein [Myxococcaceae]|uniref:carboxypeptidase-like regulatory domain-containing protein n=1 Tax=Myxococcaceae TaxID=31 RepID=UPI00188FE4F3|nr:MULTISPECIES: carboxypeptidase-like regulatory domain-containing protein [Myxococcaceae]MBF5042413.1 carboxypeptidase regulatory-like domain-containing protein [Simulacricoccus sp. 17bor-14]
MTAPPPRPGCLLEFPATSPTGTLVGTVHDARTQEPLAGVRVSVSSPELPAERIAVTDVLGWYRFAELAPGSYGLRFERRHFEPCARARVELSGGRLVHVVVDLRPADAEEHSIGGDEMQVLEMDP